VDRTVAIDERYRGPGDRGNGGYTGGFLAPETGEPTEVTLRRPSPLNRPLTVHLGPAGQRLLLDGDELIAAAVPIPPLDLDVPPPVTFDEAREAERHSARLEPDPDFPGCFSCGPERGEGDGLRILAGRVVGREVYAATWIPRAEFADGHGNVRTQILWAALDCSARAPLVPEGWEESLLGRMALEVLAAVPVERRYVVMSWRLRTARRKGYAADALLGEAGTVHAVARSTWIRPAD
jgi:hypothetical protein